MKYGLLVPMRLIGRTKQYQQIWLCQCDCGKEKAIRLNALKTGNTKSCGCLNLRRIAERNFKHGHKTRQKTSKEYTCWVNMKARCSNPTAYAYKWYGAKGIAVCYDWEHSFERFLEDMGPMPEGNYQIDRIDPTKDYMPSNCRWLLKSLNVARRNYV